MKLYGETKINFIAKTIGRDSKDVFEKWLEIQSNKKLARRVWTKSEDELLIKLATQFA